jgi:hypothetical protein
LAIKGLSGKDGIPAEVAVIFGTGFIIINASLPIASIGVIIEEYP